MFHTQSSFLWHNWHNISCFKMEPVVCEQNVKLCDHTITLPYVYRQELNSMACWYIVLHKRVKNYE